jgi:glyceraldehyde 3-phosphate dehydrogenase
MNVGINGFGRIGRLFLRAILHADNLPFTITHLNDLADFKCLCDLLELDSAHGTLGKTVKIDGNKILIDGYSPITFSQTAKAEEIPWDQSKVDVVLESTGFFTTKEKASLHLKKGVKKVIISAPADGEVDNTIVIGANEETLKDTDIIVSNASCTTNSITSVLKVIKENFGIQNGLLTTTHAYTMDQRLHDAPHKDLRRARAACHSIIPSSTGAAKLAGKLIGLSGKIDGMSLRVPVITGSLTQVNLNLEKATTKEEVNSVLKKACESLKGIVHYTEKEIVSSDIVGDPRSCIIDASITKVLNDKLLQLNCWYDNEWGFSNRLIDLLKMIAENKYGQKFEFRNAKRSSGANVSENY